MTRNTSQEQGIDRRAVLTAGCVAAACVLDVLPAVAGAESDRPSKGDRLVVDDTGPNKGKTIAPDMLALGGRLVSALPADRATGIVRSASRFNKIVLLRLPVEELAEAVRLFTVEGVIAFSGICTHQSCAVTAWKDAERRLVCFCHGSEFSATEGGRVVKGPATKRLPILPLARGDDGALIVADEFTAKPGPA